MGKRCIVRGFVYGREWTLEMLAVLIAATKPESDNINIVIPMHRKSIVERYRQEKITNNLDVKLWSTIE